MKIYCCGCQRDVDAILTNGAEVYPHRPDLRNLPFWVCTTCGNFVGCHHKTNHPTRPLGVIPTPEIKRARQRVHAIIDQIWQSGRMTRTELYKKISSELGREYHTANIRSVAEADHVIYIASGVAD